MALCACAPAPPRSPAASPSLPAFRTAPGSLHTWVIEYRTWPEAVAKLQANPHSEGQPLHIVVDDDNGEQLPCDAYRLGLDAIGAEAFAIEDCDPESGVTTVRLRDWDALFDGDGDASRPRTPLLVTSDTAPSAPDVSPNAALRCFAAVHPFVRDRGSLHYLTPGHYDLRVPDDTLEVRPDGDRWLIGGHPSKVDYEVVDGRAAKIVVEGETTLQCGVSPPSASPGIGRRVRGSTRDRADRRQGSCGGDGSADRTIPLHLDRPTRIRLRLEASYDGVLYLVDHSGGDELSCAHTNLAERLAVIDRRLPAGDYDVVVDGSGAAQGDFVLYTTEVAPGTPRENPAVRGHLVLGGEVRGDTSYSFSNRYEPGCQHSYATHAPEYVYRLLVPERTFVAMRLTPADGRHLSLSVRDTLEPGADERMCSKLDARHHHESEVYGELEAGEYYVLVDSDHDGAPEDSAGAYRLAVHGELARDAMASHHVRGSLASGEVERTLADGISVFSPSCARTTSAEDVFELDVTQPSRVTVRATAGFHPVVALRRSLTPGPGEEIACGRSPEASTQDSASVSVHLDPGRYYVVVESGYGLFYRSRGSDRDRGRPHFRLSGRYQLDTAIEAE